MNAMENDELTEYLESLRREECYRVDEVLKESPHEVTQRVSFLGENGSARGPFIRKLIRRDAGIGGVYERLFAAQRAGQRFKHVPAILECYAHDDNLVVVMECVRGETLQDLVFRRDPSLGLAQEVFPGICDAVSELHGDFDPPIIHRDLKPSNVIVSQGGCTIIDFGIAREFKEGASDDTAHFGTRSFAPPEQFGFGQTTVRSDVYALGMLLYFCLTETIPNANDRANWYVDSRVPKRLRGVIAKATALDPRQRYESADELKGAFLAACEDELVPTRGSAAPASASAQRAEGTAAAGGNVAAAHQVQAGQPAQAPHIIGRIWNVAVIVGFAALCAGILYYLVIGLFFDPGTLSAPAPNAIAGTVLGILFFALLAFACLDKRRIRQRVPALASVKAWQYWAVVLIAYVVVAGAGRLLR